MLCAFCCDGVPWYHFVCILRSGCGVGDGIGCGAGLGISLGDGFLVGFKLRWTCFGYGAGCPSVSLTMFMKSLNGLYISLHPPPATHDPISAAMTAAIPACLVMSVNMNHEMRPTMMNGSVGVICQGSIAFLLSLCWDVGPVLAEHRDRRYAPDVEVRLFFGDRHVVVSVA